MTRVLLENFEHVYVFTLPSDSLPPEYVDQSLATAELVNPRLHVVPVAPLLGGYGIVARPKLLQRMIGAMLTRLFCSNGSDWVPPLSAALKRIGQETRIDLIVSTGGPFTPFVPVIKFAANAGIPSIIDYRDLWTANPRAPYPALCRFLVRRSLELYVNRRCSVITTVSHGCRETLAGSQSGLPQVRTLMNTPDEAYTKWFMAQPGGGMAQFDSRYLNILLAGTVYEECTCRLLLHAMQQLDATTRAQVKVHYMGLSGDLVAAEFGAAGLTDNLVNHGFVKKQVAAAAAKSADALLSLIFDSTKKRPNSAVLGLMTTKVFDYFLAGKPIINVGPPQADVCVLAKEIGYGEFHSFDASRGSELAAFLATALQDLHAFRQRTATAQLPDFAAGFNQILAHVQA